MKMHTIGTVELFTKLKSAGFEDAQSNVLLSLFSQIQNETDSVIENMEDNLNNLNRNLENEQIQMKWILRVFSVVAVILYIKSLL